MAYRHYLLYILIANFVKLVWISNIRWGLFFHDEIIESFNLSSSISFCSSICPKILSKPSAELVTLTYHNWPDLTSRSGQTPDQVFEDSIWDAKYTKCTYTWDELSSSYFCMHNPNSDNSGWKCKQQPSQQFGLLNIR